MEKSTGNGQDYQGMSSTKDETWLSLPISGRLSRQCWNLSLASAALGKVIPKGPKPSRDIREVVRI